MEQSILLSIKKLLGITPEYDAFDMDIILHINSVFVILFQLGVGDKPYSIVDNSNTWDEIVPDESQLEMIKSYIYAKVRMMFDPPTIGAVNTSLDNMIKELEWRISVAVDPGEVE